MGSSFTRDTSNNIWICFHILKQLLRNNAWNKHKHTHTHSTVAWIVHTWTWLMWKRFEWSEPISLNWVVEEHGLVPQQLLVVMTTMRRSFYSCKIGLLLGLLIWYVYISCAPYRDRAAQVVFTSVRNGHWERCKQIFGRGHLPIMPSEEDCIFHHDVSMK